MSKIWSGGASREGSVDISELMVDDDTAIDQNFLEFEALALIAYHLEIFREGLIDPEDSISILRSLLLLFDRAIVLKPELEDVHGNVEEFVISNSGKAGDNLRLFLSRNEQIHTDILLYGRSILLELALRSAAVSEAVLKKRDEFSGSMPGYTHYRQGMVVSVKTYMDYIAAIFEGSAKELLEAAQKIQSLPLGYGSGFGSLSDADFSKISESLGMNPVPVNPQYLSSRRGIDEADILYPVLKLMINISRVSQDLIMFSGDEIPIFILPDGFVTGSSLMANKRNPDFLEMLQGYASEQIGSFSSLISMVANKSSGYHRDFQISKKIMVKSLQRSISIMKFLPEFFAGIGFDAEASGNIIRNSSYATANARKLFNEGQTWKKAYSEAGRMVRERQKLEEIKPEDVTTITSDNLSSIKGAIQLEISRYSDISGKLIAQAKKLTVSG